jgi:hypothetical protein
MSTSGEKELLGEGDFYQWGEFRCLGRGMSTSREGTAVWGGGLRSLHVIIGQLLGSLYSTCMYRWQGNGIDMYCTYMVNILNGWYVYGSGRDDLAYYVKPCSSAWLKFCRLRNSVETKIFVFLFF